VIAQSIFVQIIDAAAPIICHRFADSTMKAKTELILYHLFWMADIVMRPSPGRIGESFEEWAYQGGFLRQIRELERRGMIESSPQEKGSQRVLRLTQKGSLRALGGTDLAERWARPWDGKWRMALFDLPEEKRALRNALRKELRQAHFGCLQGSVWITPDPVEDLLDNLMKKSGEQSRTILFFSGRPCDGSSDTDLVAAAWNFNALKTAYRDYRAHLKTLPRGGDHLREQLLDWGNIERDLWSRCMALDPLLPRPLWPKNYAGEKAWNERLLCFKAAGKIASQL